MAYNTEIIKNSLEDITRDDFRDALGLAFRDGITSHAPLGYSGDDVVLHGTAKGGRSRLITVRNHSGMAELLITNAVGNFLYLGKFDIDFGDEFISNQFWLTYRLVKDKI